jgi:hypothetical protein
MAKYAWSLKEKYRQTYGMTKVQFMKIYNLGEIQLSSVFENLLPATRNRFGKPTEKCSVDGYDFVKIESDKPKPLGDMKTCTAYKNGYSLKFAIRNAHNKQGYLYVVGYNPMNDKVYFFAIPPTVKRPKTILAITVCPKTGVITSNKYGKYQVNSWEEMALKG